MPEHLRSDNGPEFIAQAIQDWLKGKNVKTIYITPGSPWENAYIENFHVKLRDECMNREVFGSLWEARVVIEQWCLYYSRTVRWGIKRRRSLPVAFFGGSGLRPEAEYVSRKHDLVNRKAELKGKLEAFEHNRRNRFEPASRS